MNGGGDYQKKREKSDDDRIEANPLDQRHSLIPSRDRDKVPVKCEPPH